jgi:hypothetical protein
MSKVRNNVERSKIQISKIVVIKFELTKFKITKFELKKFGLIKFEFTKQFSREAIFKVISSFVTKNFELSYFRTFVF